MHQAAKLISHAVLLAVFTSGCASTGLNSARRDYHNGQYQKAADDLVEDKFPEKDRVLFKMERGMVRQAAGDYDGSTKDFLDAYDTLEQMVALSVSQDSASMVINDNVQDFQSVPFERTLLHTFTAKNHLLQSNWENAAVEARRIIQSLSEEVKKDYPEDAYSRYMAGFCLSLIGDWSNAAMQFRLAGELLDTVTIDERTGMIFPGTNDVSTVWPTTTNQLKNELVVFVMMGRSPSGEELMNQNRPILPAGYADIVIDGHVAGRSYELADTVDLAFTTKQKDAIREMAKTMTRIAAKEAAAYSIDQHDELLGALFRLIMIGLLEQPDVRRWETLPRSLQVARVPCPENPGEIEVRFNTSSGVETRSLKIIQPIPRHYRTYITVVRDSQLVL
jgi:uncharacterized protein